MTSRLRLQTQISVLTEHVIVSIPHQSMTSLIKILILICQTIHRRISITVINKCVCLSNKSLQSNLSDAFKTDF